MYREENLSDTIHQDSFRKKRQREHKGNTNILTDEKDEDKRLESIISNYVLG